MKTLLNSNRHKIISFLFFIILISSCKKTSDLEFEKEVFYELYPSLVDSTWVENQIGFTPPPPPHLDENGKLMEYQPLNKTQLRKDYSVTLADLKKNSFKISIIINDRIEEIKLNKKELQKHFKDAILNDNSTSDSISYLIDQQKINTIKSIQSRFVSNYRMAIESRVWDSIKRFGINGVVSFSRIQFDKNNKYGMLTSSIICGGLCGNGYTIYIKKVHNKWIIDKIEHTWIS